jgi:hypothetical protein
MQPQGAPMLGYCCVVCHRFMQTLANSTVAGIPQWPVLPRSPLPNASATALQAVQRDPRFLYV